jgi:inositol hexakisphosphate/diphosphoinositol-pentakisphosphate kinase
VLIRPLVDFLISFFSSGFPLGKAIEYLHLRNPISLNDLPMQQLLLDRRLVLALLDASGVPTPKRLVTWNRDCPNLYPEVKNKADKLGIHIDKYEQLSKRVTLSEDGQVVMVGEASLSKPFVEKPVSGEDHNIYIYYAESEGGGVRKLFRKKGNKSSEFFDRVEGVRSHDESSYIYEEFMSVDNAEDVKVREFMWCIHMLGLYHWSGVCSCRNKEISRR